MIYYNEEHDWMLIWSGGDLVPERRVVKDKGVIKVEVHVKNHTWEAETNSEMIKHCLDRATRTEMGFFDEKHAEATWIYLQDLFSKERKL